MYSRILLPAGAPLKMPVFTNLVIVLDPLPSRNAGLSTQRDNFSGLKTATCGVGAGQKSDRKFQKKSMLAQDFACPLVSPLSY